VEEQELSITAKFVYFTVDFITTRFGLLKKVKHVAVKYTNEYDCYISKIEWEEMSVYLRDPVAS
jgi:hypothetical protein